MSGYTAAALKIAAPAGGFADNGWYAGRNYDAATQTFGEANQNWSNNNPDKNKGQVSAEVRAQSAAAQGKTPAEFDSYLASQGASNLSGNGFGDSWSPSGSPGSGGGVGYTAPAPIDLMGEYNTLQDNAGIAGIQAELQAKKQSYDKATSQINDNPFLSESSRVGRVQKLSTDYQNSTATTQDKLKLAQADADTRMGLYQKQYDINNAATQQSLKQFDSLLQSGALNGASVDDIAGLSKSTGMSTGMIQSAIKASNDKNVQTSTISFDDGTNQGFAIINTKTGQVISKQIIAASKPTAAEQKAATGGGGSTTASAAQNKQQAVAQLPTDARNGWTLGTMMNFYQQFGLSAQQIYNTYRSANYYKATPAQQKADQAKYHVK